MSRWTWLSCFVAAVFCFGSMSVVHGQGTQPGKKKDKDKKAPPKGTTPAPNPVNPKPTNPFPKAPITPVIKGPVLTFPTAPPVNPTVPTPTQPVSLTPQTLPQALLGGQFANASFGVGMNFGTYPPNFNGGMIVSPMPYTNAVNPFGMNPVNLYANTSQWAPSTGYGYNPYPYAATPYGMPQYPGPSFGFDSSNYTNRGRLNQGWQSNPYANPYMNPYGQSMVPQNPYGMNMGLNPYGMSLNGNPYSYTTPVDPMMQFGYNPYMNLGMMGTNSSPMNYAMNNPSGGMNAWGTSGQTTAAPGMFSGNQMFNPSGVSGKFTSSSGSFSDPGTMINPLAPITGSPFGGSSIANPPAPGAAPPATPPALLDP